MDLKKKEHLCIYCLESNIKTKDIYAYCDNCKTIVFDSGKSTNIIKTQILNHLEKTNELLLRDKETLHTLLQNKINKKELTISEKELYEFSEKFQEIRRELKFLLNEHTDLSNKKIRQLLFQLLELTEKSKTISGGKYYV